MKVATTSYHGLILWCHLLLVKIGHCAIKIRSYSMYVLLYLNMYTCMYDTYLDTLICRVVYIDTVYILCIYYLSIYDMKHMRLHDILLNIVTPMWL